MPWLAKREERRWRQRRLCPSRRIHGSNLLQPLKTAPGFANLSKFVKFSVDSRNFRCHSVNTPRSERSPAEGHGNPLQYPCLVNSMNRGASQATDHGVLKSWTRLSTHIVKETYKLSTLNLPFPSAHRYIDTMMMLRKPDCLEATLLRLEVVVEFRSPEFQMSVFSTTAYCPSSFQQKISYQYIDQSSDKNNELRLDNKLGKACFEILRQSHQKYMRVGNM